MCVGSFFGALPVQIATTTGVEVPRVNNRGRKTQLRVGNSGYEVYLGMRRAICLFSRSTANVWRAACLSSLFSPRNKTACGLHSACIRSLTFLFKQSARLMHYVSLTLTTMREIELLLMRAVSIIAPVFRERVACYHSPM